MSETEKPLNSDDIVDIGEEHHKAGRLQEAESCYRQALEIDPGHPGALYYLANIACEDGRLQLAAQFADELLRDEPNDAEAWHLLGMIAFKEDNLTRAIECINKALAIQPAYVQAYYSLGTIFSKRADYDSALANFQRAVALNPGFVEAHCSIGNICRVLDKFDDAISSYRQAIKAKPDCELAYEGIGEILLAQGKREEAIANFQQAIAANAGSAMVYAWLGSAYAAQDQHDAAIASCERAILLDPSCFIAHFALGSALFKHGKLNEAVTSFRRALALNSQDARLLSNLANALYSLGEIDQAADIYRQWLELEPDNPVARHHLAGCTREAIPMRAEDAYVESVFDDFAESFDEKLGKLGYRGPQLLAEAMRRECGMASKQFSLLDAGCGTGLCGPLIADYCKQLIGVDLSAGMLAKAELYNVYDELVKAELTAYLQSQPQAFDVILSADTLLYFGDLEDVLMAARAATRDDGYLFFSTEVLIDDGDESKSGQGYSINPHGRYCHSEAYLRRMLDKAGFTILTIETAILRYEFSHPVQSFVISCRAE